MTAPDANAADREAMLRVLSEHHLSSGGRNLGQYRTEWACACGGTFVTDGHSGPALREANAAHLADALRAAGFVGPERVAAIEAERDEARALLRRVLDGRVRHDHAYPMEVPHRCDGCDLFDEIAALAGPTVASPDGVPINEARARLDALEASP